MPELYPIRLIVGLGNPGEEYAKTRHNAGAWYIEQLAVHLGITLQPQNKFLGKVASFHIKEKTHWLLAPNTFMNMSGQAVRAMSQFYQIPAHEILVIHDELDFAPGVIRLKLDGGHGGHNGLRDIIRHLSTDKFYRLRVGIGHPGDRNKVSDYVLSCPSKSEFILISDAIQRALNSVPELVLGDIQKAMKDLHT